LRRAGQHVDAALARGRVDVVGLDVVAAAAVLVVVVAPARDRSRGWIAEEAEGEGEDVSECARATGAARRVDRSIERSIERAIDRSIDGRGGDRSHARVGFLRRRSGRPGKEGRTRVATRAIVAAAIAATR
jgi:pyruvoyl-dependent arginine decarboxylase (PvlArgDC)